MDQRTFSPGRGTGGTASPGAAEQRNDAGVPPAASCTERARKTIGRVVDTAGGVARGYLEYGRVILRSSASMLRGRTSSRGGCGTFSR
jgi:hypothetical protein